MKVSCFVSYLLNQKKKEKYLFTHVKFDLVYHSVDYILTLESLPLPNLFGR